MKKTSRRPPSAANTLRVQRFAHLDDLSLELGDLTVLVGEQGSGKSLALQLLKLAIDGRAIAATMRDYGLVYSGNSEFLSRYLGEGMESAWGPATRLFWQGKRIEVGEVWKNPKTRKHSVYLVPAHRTLILSGGYPPTFQQFLPDTPFVVRQFSEEVRSVLRDVLGSGATLFPQEKRLKGKVREKIGDSVFHGAALREDSSGIQRQLKLVIKRARLPYMTWSAGQREFIPLLLGLYYLLPAGGQQKRPETSWVVIEEGEMGLHPKAIVAFMLLVLDLLSRGYRVVLSTHSPLVLDIVWALRALQRRKADWSAVLALFGVHGVTKATARGEVRMAESALRKVYRAHYLQLSRGKVRSQDISTLDPGSPDAAVAGWGGLTKFSGDIGRIVAAAVSGG